MPDPGPTTVEEQLAGYEPWARERAERPFVAMNFAATVDGRATIGGVSGPIGSDADTAMLVGLRTRFDAVLIGAGTMRAERYGPPVADPGSQVARERLGLAPAPLTAIVSGSLDLPWDAPLFGDADARVLIFAASGAEAPETAAALEVVRHEGAVNIAEALRHLRQAHGVRAVLSEGGPRLHAQMQGGGMVDELFLTVAPKLAGGAGPRVLEGELPETRRLELLWLLEEEGELFARYGAAR